MRQSEWEQQGGYIMQSEGNRYSPLIQIIVVLTAVFLIASVIPTGITAQQEPAGSEPNDSPENAVRLNFESTSFEGVSEAELGGFSNQSSPARFGPGDQEDWYAFDVEAGQAIRFWGYTSRVSGIQGNLIGPSGRVLANNSFWNENTAHGTVAEESGTYYIQVQNESDAITPISYELTVQVTDSDSFEPNDDLDAAAPVASGEQLRGTIAEGSESDWFAVDVSSGSTINATLRTLTYDAGGPMLPRGISVDLFTSDGSRIGEVVDLDQPRTPSNVTNAYAERDKVGVVAELEETGTYYVRVSGTPPEGFTPYSLTVSTNSPEDSSSSDLPNSLAIESTGSERAFYTFATSGQVELGERANPVEATNPDSVSGSSASGSVAQNGVDDYRFSGNLTDISVDGPANVYVNGEQIETNETRTNENAFETSSEQVTPPSSTDTLSTTDPTVAPSLKDTITVKSTGDERAKYQFTVVGNVTYGDNANPVEAEFPDEIDGEIVSGSVAEGGKDNYRFSGVVFQESFYIDGPAKVYINGERVNRETTLDDQTQYMNQIVISEQATSDSATYEFSVTGELQKMDNSSDEVTDGHVSGSVSTESDIYRYTGMIEDFEYSGTPQVFVKGEKVDPAVLAGEKRATTITTTFAVQSTTTQSTVDDSTETNKPTSRAQSQAPPSTPDRPEADRPTGQTDASGPGFGIVAVVAALAGITLIRTRSLRQP